jgi:ribosomal protein S18 acetylase RimI-like enzyme
MNLLRKLFQRPPTPGWDIIYDKRGTRYEATFTNKEGFLRVDVWGRRRVGLIQALWEPEHVVHVADVIIFRQNQRGRGLGKAMMQYFVQSIRQLGATSIYGIAIPNSGCTMEYLLGFYRSLGFEITETEKGGYELHYSIPTGAGELPSSNESQGMRKQ